MLSISSKFYKNISIISTMVGQQNIVYIIK